MPGAAAYALHRPSVSHPAWSRRTVAAAAVVLALGAAAGALAAVQPIWAVAPFAVLALVAFAFLAPVAHLTALLIMTVVVGYALQHKFGSHLIPSDALLLTGLLRAGVVLARKRLEPRRLAVLCLTVAFAVGTILQVVHGLRAGYDSSTAGQDGRILLGFAALVIAMPILDEPDGRRRLGRCLVIVGLLLALWGLATWALGISLGSNVDVGVRSTSGSAGAGLGSGQLHGGLYGYPVAVIMGAAVLIAARGVRGLTRWALIAVVALNAMCIVLTYERTFWVTTLVALVFVIAKAGRGRRLRAVVAILGTALMVLALLYTLLPSDLGAIEARVLTLGQASDLNTVRYRAVETGFLLQKVEARPLLGWGAGDTLYWGQPWELVPPTATWFAHNGYLWVIWKFGAFVAALLFLLLAWAIASRAPPERDPKMRAFRVGAQGGLLLLLLSSVTFPSFNSLTITATMGVLMAICFMPRERPERRLPRSTATAASNGRCCVW